MDAEALRNYSRDVQAMTESRNGYEMAWEWPAKIGRGRISRIKLNAGLSLGLANFQVFETIELPIDPIRMPVIFHFFSSWSGNCRYSFMDKHRHRSPGPGVGGSVEYRREWHGVFNLPRDIPVQGLAVYIDPLLLGPFMHGHRFPSGLCDIAKGNRDTPFNRVFLIAPAIQVAIHQVLDCAYTGPLKRFFLEGKTLELITYALSQLVVEKNAPPKAPGLTRNDIDRVRNIKEILLNNLDKPPSLLELARESGTNKNKLNADFRRVFGTSVFEFLRVRRLEYAKALLENKKMNVTDAAFEVGYAHQQSFTRAFKNHFGTNPVDHIN